LCFYDDHNNMNIISNFYQVAMAKLIIKKKQK
jgi:hypothetical protein